mmetsp:Transcript_23508/g.63478  ORF Transcript_23508/g.63478 Transcript_23508/m.63478 type:complete len:94 (-) Transcript_23508:164-445(-)
MLFQHFYSSQEVKELLSFKPSLVKDAVDPAGNTLLHIAAREGHKRIVKELLRHQAWFDINARNEAGKTALELAQALNYGEVAEYLQSKLEAAR